MVLALTVAKVLWSEYYYRGAGGPTVFDAIVSLKFCHLTISECIAASIEVISEEQDPIWQRRARSHVVVMSTFSCREIFASLVSQSAPDSTHQALLYWTTPATPAIGCRRFHGLRMLGCGSYVA
jgi:hypothetical protein